MQKHTYKNRLSFKNKIYRFVWLVVWTVIFKNIPTKRLNKIRILILKIFGAQIGEGSGVYSNCRIWAPNNLVMGKNSWIGPNTIIYNVGKVVIGNDVTISQYSYLCAASHDYNDSKFSLIYSEIKINDGVWIAADTYLGMGVSIGKNTIVGARSAVFKSFGENLIIGGNPARIIKEKR